ncbi:serine protein kinase RIO [Candidatus Woesearchaeota archaeon]|nr:serine protein kinase RIO [Candidatus Woesearchaeota archaeon]
MARKFRERFKTLNDVFDQFTIRNLFVLGSKDHFVEGTLSPLSIGKEANIFTAAAKGEGRRVVIKIYRLETCDFNSMYRYISPDPRYSGLKKRPREIVFAWCQREYRNLLACREAGVRAPLPLAFLKNILVMTQVGEHAPAQKMKDDVPKKPQQFFREIIEDVKKLYHYGYVHSDLSKFNILNDNQRPVLIDFSQMVPMNAPNAYEYLSRDVENVADFFRRLGVKIDSEKVYKEIVAVGTKKV